VFCADNPVNCGDPFGEKFDYSGLSEADLAKVAGAIRDARSTTPGQLLYQILEASAKVIPVRLGPSTARHHILQISAIPNSVDETVEELQHIAEDITGKSDPANLGIDVTADTAVDSGGGYESGECRGKRAANIAVDQYKMRQAPWRGHPDPIVKNHGIRVAFPYGTKYDPNKHWARWDP
jgi:hypothetical protein